MGKLKDFLKASNHWRHLVGGFGVGVCSNDVYCAAYAGVGIASALEFKDKSWGGKWDWIDWSLTLIGVAIGYSVRFVLDFVI